MSEKSYLLDANILICLLEESTAAKEKKLLLQKLSDPNSEFFLTPLIHYEVLRGVAWKDCKKLVEFQNALAKFDMLDISLEVADLARDLYRFDKSLAEEENKLKNLDKRKFDMFHYATAKINNLELLSADMDIDKIDRLYDDMLKRKAT